ncbi:conserved hypothetical protein [Culex quinquefasciatus]|uniref:Ionotropic glutamate receptor L-glutamate and glycine-binding domain-containing protein n=1 Tax=Culex quinquefasciatus TaxID=7176 RepID=B0WXY5_CULQU|nr:conserved hypothetical protein [Culex quinquefasciatus]|eukprot:XP_001862257.1 conserved hypothetical protein [Culex quinquefasciatus]
MKLLKLIVLLLLYSYCFGSFTQENLWQNLSIYIESLLRYQVNLKPTQTFNVWFNRTASQFPYDDIINNLIGFDFFQTVPRVLMRISEVKWAVTADNYSVFFLHVESELPQLDFNINAKFIIFGAFYNCSEMSNVSEHFTSHSKLDVLYFSITTQLICYFEPICKNLKSFHEYPDPTALFPDQTRNLCGHTIVAMAMPTLEYLCRENGDCFGPDVNMIEVITRQINATLDFASYDQLHQLPRHKTPHILLNRFNMLIPGTFVSAEPFSYSVLTKFKKQIVEDIEHLSSPLDGVSAYLLRSDWANAIIQAPGNVDPITRIPRYVAVHEKLMVSNGYYPISIYWLYERMMLIQRMLFEGGIRQLWVRNFYNRQYSWLHSEVAMNDRIFFSNIVPAWILLGILTCYFEPYCKQIVSAQNFPDPATLFPDQTRNLCGHSIVATAVPSFDHIYHNGQDLIGPDVNFIQETARHINASLSLVRHDNLNGRNLHYKTIDIVLNRFNMARLGSLVSVEPFSYTVYVPRGRRLTQFELFVAPFRPLVWILLGCLLVSFKVLEFIFPRKLRRNFTFLTFFGFLNSANLTRITRVETFSIVLITIVMFFLFRAYETKVIAMMVNTPYLSTVKTLQQLVDTKFPIKLDFRNVGIVYSMPKLNKLVVKDIEHLSSPLDGVSAYLLRSDWADAIIFDPRNVDPISKMPLYVPVNEKLMISNGYYPISIYALHDRLMLTQRMLFEAGIRQLWRL